MLSATLPVDMLTSVTWHEYDLDKNQIKFGLLSSSKGHKSRTSDILDHNWRKNSIVCILSKYVYGLKTTSITDNEHDWHIIWKQIKKWLHCLDNLLRAWQISTPLLALQKCYLETVRIFGVGLMVVVRLCVLLRLILILKIRLQADDMNECITMQFIMIILGENEI